MPRWCSPSASISGRLPSTSDTPTLASLTGPTATCPVGDAERAGHPARRSFGDDDLWTDAGLIAVGEPTIEERLDKALTKAAKVVKRTVEATTDEITSELQEALKS
jgi:hypothetical protein